jgi:Sec-independent protein secretion pathway component TatC
MMAGPLIALYEVGIFIARIAEKKEGAEDDAFEEGVKE